MTLFNRKSRQERLFTAVQGGQYRRAASFLKRGADMNRKNDQGDTVLHIAASLGRTDFAELLIAHGADVNVRNKFGETPLHVAASAGSKDVLALLIAKGADLNATNPRGRTPLHVASEIHDKSAVEVLASHGADVNIKDKYGETPLRSARHKLKTWDKLASHAARGTKDTAALDAASESFIYISKVLKKHGAVE